MIASPIRHRISAPSWTYFVGRHVPTAPPRAADEVHFGRAAGSPLFRPSWRGIVRMRDQRKVCVLRSGSRSVSEAKVPAKLERSSSPD